MLRPSIRPFAMSRGFRVCVEYGSIEYSAVSQPPVMACSFIQRGTILFDGHAADDARVAHGNKHGTPGVRGDAEFERNRAQLIAGSSINPIHNGKVDRATVLSNELDYLQMAKRFVGRTDQAFREITEATCEKFTKKEYVWPESGRSRRHAHCSRDCTAFAGGFPKLHRRALPYGDSCCCGG